MVFDGNDEGGMTGRDGLESRDGVRGEGKEGSGAKVKRRWRGRY